MLQCGRNYLVSFSKYYRHTESWMDWYICIFPGNEETYLYVKTPKSFKEVITITRIKLYKITILPFSF